MKKIIKYFLGFGFFCLFFLLPSKTLAGSYFAGIKIIIKDQYKNPLNGIVVDLRSDTNATYTGGGITRYCDSDSRNTAGPFVNLNFNPDQYYHDLHGFKTGETYTYNNQTYDNPAGTLYFGNGVNSTTNGGGMGFGFACSCNPLKIIIHVPNCYCYNGVCGDEVTISKGGLENGKLYEYTFTLYTNTAPSAYYDSPANGTVFEYTPGSYQNLTNYGDYSLIVPLRARLSDVEKNDLSVKVIFGSGEFNSGWSAWTPWISYNDYSQNPKGRNIVFKINKDGTWYWTWAYGYADWQKGSGNINGNGRSFWWNIQVKDLCGEGNSCDATNGQERAWRFTIRAKSQQQSEHLLSCGSISGNQRPKVGETITLSYDGTLDTSGHTNNFSYKWLISDDGGKNYTEVDGQPGSPVGGGGPETTYSLYIGKLTTYYVKVRVSCNNVSPPYTITCPDGLGYRITPTWAPFWREVSP